MTMTKNNNITDIEKNLAESKDMLQVIYFQEYKHSTNEIIIIENNLALINTLQNYLIQLGFENIYVCQTAKEGEKIFKNLMTSGKIVPIILDDRISENISHIIKQLLAIQPDVKIIVETSFSENDPETKHLFDLGIFSIISKPLRFQNLQETIDILCKEDRPVTEDKPVTENTDIELNEKIKNILKSKKIISSKRINENIDVNLTTIEECLKKLEDKKILVSTDEIKEVACPKCRSVETDNIAICPYCKKSDFGKYPVVIHHYRCDQMFLYESKLEKCRVCNTNLGKQGTDYAKFTNYYLCSSCENYFGELESIYECRKCETQFNLHNANIESSMRYKIL